MPAKGYRKPITDVNLRFRDKYFELGSITAAAKAVGKGWHWATEQMKKPYMVQALKDRADLAASKVPSEDTELGNVRARAEWLEGVILGKILETKTITDKEGNEFTVTQPFPAMVRAQCMKLRCMMGGDFIAKIEVKSEHTERKVFTVVPEPLQISAHLVQAPALQASNAEYEECPQCKEMIETKLLSEHEKTCPGA